MRFLADESCDFAVVRALRRAGQDVLAIAEDSPGIEDEQVIVKAKIINDPESLSKLCSFTRTPNG